MGSTSCVSRSKYHHHQSQLNGVSTRAPVADGGDPESPSVNGFPGVLGAGRRGGGGGDDAAPRCPMGSGTVM